MPGNVISPEGEGSAAGAAERRAVPAPAAGAKPPTKEKVRKNDRRPHEIYMIGDQKYIGTQHIRSPEDQASNRAITEPDLKNPALMAYLTLVSMTEGTNGEYKYYERYGRKRLKDLSRFYYGNGISDASGMFQIQGETYDEVAIAKLGLNDFSPRTQLMTAMFLLRSRHIREPLLAGDIVGAIARGKDVWASLPDPGTNKSRYGKSGTKHLQPSADLATAIATYKRLKIIWEKRLTPSTSSK